MFLLKWIFFQFVKIYMFVLSLLRVRDFTIYKRELEYKIDGDVDESYELTPFWKRESCYMHQGWNWADVTGVTIGNLPPYVKDIILRIKYSFDGKVFTMVTKDPNYTWPPVKATQARFRMPIKSVEMVDVDDKPILDVTKKYKKVEGPYGDFWNQTDVMIEDLFSFVEYDKLKITYVTNTSKLIPKTSTLQELL